DKKLVDRRMLSSEERVQNGPADSFGGVGSGSGAGIGPGQAGGRAGGIVTETVVVTAGSQVLDEASAKKPMSRNGALKVDGIGRLAEVENKQAAQAEPAVQVRTDFRATALWIPDVITDQNGTA